MNGRVRDPVLIVVAVVSLVLAVVCWRSGVTTSEFAPVVEGGPPFTATHWSGPWIGAASVAVVVAGLALIGVWRARR